MVTETQDRKINTDAKIHDDDVKRLPHERDESPDGHDKEPRGVMKQAADDLAQGLVDTDMHGMRGVEVVAPAGGSGQARPKADAGSGMRHHEPSNQAKGKDKE
ncbi:hypothetical protein LXA47_27515 [Massilia sp. P8910]|uniref:hypothetical protein n=1 Tax=Massilia TaxID=149698 RepID=UPI0006BB80B9|nr:MULTISPECIES: hypothetical protein [Massilia]CUI05650.1 hypothetical protein BN2497_6077 [Janthinobacterium sp. CG23_2]MCE3607319.1 hypothetical protein [Massilia antarctica]MCY0916028.1 hypothetical protein [Massilia sp. H27-R4]MDM5177242.1 hypothetical protein [Massilia sp. DJPM01]CUU29436.1 hypothetical protein BN3177_6077 [Janthinobacterium sp. CG23_2]